MQPKPRRGNVVLLGDGVFEVLDLIKIRPPGPWWWHTEDINDPDGARGAIFRCYEDNYVAADGNLQELAYLLAADVTDDASEPDIARFEQADAERFERILEHAVRDSVAHGGREMIKWMSSHLSETSLGKGLMSGYIARDQGRERQYIDLRLRIRDRNAIIGGCFDISRKDDLVKPIWEAIQESAHCSRLPQQSR
jgi:hypothetical protein